MKLIRFPRGDDEALLDPEKVSHITKEKVSENMIKSHKGETFVDVYFNGEAWLRFGGEDAEKVWEYFTDTWRIDAT